MAETSRDTILQSLRAARLESVELPEADPSWCRFADPKARFAQVLESVGGRCLSATDLHDANRQLTELPEFQQATWIGSTVAGVDGVNLDAMVVGDPHELERLDLFVAKGQFAIAENGAVWVSDAQVPHRALWFIVQHLVLIVPADQIVHNLHQAYQRLRFDHAEFGLLIAGPSKTADIEQSLIIGAHGARSLTVMLLDHGP